MMKKFRWNYEAQRFRAERALTWLAFEGTELHDVQVGLFSIWDFHGVGADEEVETILKLMEARAVDHAREIREDSGWADPVERTNVLACLRELRKTGNLHPDIARFV